MAITVNAQGQVLQNGQWVTTNQSDEFKAAIDKAKKESGGKGVDENTTFAIVEKGDWLFKIAGQYGVNGSKLAYTDNKQFADNPNLIYEGEAVFVNGGKASAGDEPGNPLAGKPTGPSSAALPNPQGYQQMKTVLSDKDSTSAQRQTAVEVYLAPLTPEQRQAAVKQLDTDLDNERVLGPVMDRAGIDSDIAAVVEKLGEAA
jgi:hypothetical protein